MFVILYSRTGERRFLENLDRAYDLACDKEPQDVALRCKQALAVVGYLIERNDPRHDVPMQYVEMAEAIDPEHPFVAWTRYRVEFFNLVAEMNSDPPGAGDEENADLLLRRNAELADRLINACPREKHEAIAYVAEFEWQAMQLMMRWLAAVDGRPLEPPSAAAVERRAGDRVAAAGRPECGRARRGDAHRRGAKGTGIVREELQSRLIASRPPPFLGAS